MGKDFDYASEFNKIDLDNLKKEINELMTDSKSGGKLIMVIMGISL